MALFASRADLKVHRGRPTPKLASCNFVASARSTEALAQSGHLALSASSQIVGRFQHLKTLHHPNLCEYVEITQGKHDRLFVVTEYYDNSLQKGRLGTEANSIAQLRHWAYQALSALSYLQENQIVHAALAPSNILLDENDNIKLCGYGLYYMTGRGVDVDFPIGYPCYLAPECLSDAFENPVDYDKRDIWALGVILVEQYTRNSFWTTSDLTLIFDSLSTLSEWAAEDNDDEIWNHQGVEALDISKKVLTFLQNEPNAEIGEDQKGLEQFRHFILSCLSINVDKRPDIHSLLSFPFFDSEPLKTCLWTPGPILISDTLNPDDYDGDSLSTNSQSAAKDEQDPLQSLPISHIYELWRLAGGDVELNLIKRGVFLSMPVIERLPRTCFVSDGTNVGADVTDTTQLYTDKYHILEYKELYERLEEGRTSERFEWDTDYFKVVDENDINFLLDNNDFEPNGISEEKQHEEEIDDFCFAEPSPTLNDFPSVAPTPTTPSTSRSINKTFSLTNMSRSRSSSLLSISSPTPTTPTTPAHPTIPKLPLFLREQDVTYQYHRQSLFAELLRQYPASRKEIIHHAKADIPPVLRGKIWAAILGVVGDVQAQYDQIDKVTPAPSDRQIEVGKYVPRCHQYNQLLASSAGHAKLRRILKTWVAANEGKLVYWQGLDSLCAPFLTLNFNDEALTFACLQKFLAKYLNNFFRQDNAPVLQEYLAIFRQLLSFHDPELSTHLDMIGFVPNLYAIPWFLTLFTHVFSLDKIYHLWDKFLVGPASLPLFAGISILRQIRSTLLSCEFNDCIVLFSESFPKVDIEKCIQSAMAMCKVTPPSIVVRRHINTPTASPVPTYWWEKPLPLEDKKQEIAPRMSVHDLRRVSPYALILDVRSDQEFSRGHISSSMNVLASQLPSYATILKKLNRKYHIIVSDDEALGPAYAGELVQRHFTRVALLQGGGEAVQVHDNRRWCTCRPQKQTTAGHKGKGSEPPFVIWKCKFPTPLPKK